MVIDPSPLAGVLAAGGNAAVPDAPAVARSGKDPDAISSVVPGVPVQNYRDPPLLRCLLFHVRCICCLVKYITNRRKFQN
jgi:hypothetical protein